jgi:16S rRNA (guanine527-N7)-methyltransferase
MHELWHSLATLDDGQVTKLEGYLELLAKANETMNLTRLVDLETARLLHVADGLTLVKYIHPDTRLLADVGSGGGVPGMVLAVALPQTRVVMIESTQKKAMFLANTADALGLANVEVRGVRAEEAGRSDLRDACDVVTSRAVGELVFLAEWCSPLCRKGGKLLAMKGAKINEELPRARRTIVALNLGEPKVHAVTSLPGQTSHVIVEIPKIGKSDPAHPRDPTLAKGKPLKPFSD